MATTEGLAKAVAVLSVVWPEHTAKRLGNPEAMRVASAIFESLSDEDLLIAVTETVKTRKTLYPDDNLPGILLELGTARATERAKAAARAEGERKHQLALEGVKREKAAMYLAGATLDQKPAEMSFRDWLEVNAEKLTDTDDPLEIAMRMVGGNHTMDDRLRESIMRCINLARDRRPPVGGYGTKPASASWYEKDGQ